ncbi:DUF7507 domain-containing protein [Microbacterium luticocti]|uniref:DUF7507 domain-containing protein n=1 Tax=Microbacterium luticocti TaxID=451764 RepID=UPI00041618EB|nr:DUF11 domain-containing protein [Microbacterium luticocti]
MQTDTLHADRTARRSWRTWAAGLVVAALAVIGLSVPTAAQAATDATCDFADPGTGTYASTLCWFDMSGYDPAQAGSAGGQQMSVTLPGGYTLTYTLKVTGIAVAPVAFPTWTGSYLGNRGHYTGVAGKPALYHTVGGGVTTASLSDLTMHTADGGIVTGYALVGADAEATDRGEYLDWSSNKPLELISTLGNACGGGLGPLPSTNARCTGSNTGSSPKTGTALLAADNPSTFTLSMTGNGKEGIAFGVLISKITLNKTVVNGYPGDAFGIAVTDSADNHIGSATTDGSGHASTGALTVLTGANGEDYTLSESITSGSADNYVPSWECTRNGTPDGTIARAAGTSATTSVGIGDDLVCTITNTAKPSSLGLVKKAGTPTDVNGNGITDAGDTIAYTFTVTNTGQVPVHGVAVADPKVGTVTCPTTTLAPGASTTCTAPAYTVTDDDVTAASVKNTATATATPDGTTATVTSPPSSTETPVEKANPAITIVKSADVTALVVGANVQYTFVVTNTGNVPLTDVFVADDFHGTGSPTPDVSACHWDELQPGQQQTCRAADTYTITQDDVNAGKIDNTATATGTPPNSDPITSDPSSVRVPFQQDPKLALEKTVSPAVADEAGDELTYTFTLTNTGNVTLHSPAVNETEFTGAGTAPQVDCSQAAASLAPGQKTTCTAVYRVTQADIDKGDAVTNTATATALGPDDQTVTSDPDDASFTVTQTAGIALGKTADPTTVTAADQHVTYTFRVHNTGNVTLHDITIDETSFTGTGTAPVATCPAVPDGLAPGSTLDCTATYTVTQVDVDRGSILNTATATGTPPAGNAVTSEPAQATVTATAHPALTLTKTPDTHTVAYVGDVVTYTLTARNTGNVTLAGVHIDEGAFTGAGDLSALVCDAEQPVTLAPGEAQACTATYTVQQADLDAAGFDNDATASGTAPGGGTVDAPKATAHVTAETTAELSLTKSAAPSGTADFRVGQQVTYSFLVSNTGTATVHGISIRDDSFTGHGTLPAASCPQTTLAPGDDVTCTSVYTITQDDVDAGGIVNTATAHGTDPRDGDVVSNESTVTLSGERSPALSLVKSASPTTVDAAGDTVTYTFRVLNTGNVTLTDAAVSEVSFTGSGQLSQIACPSGIARLAPGAGVDCTATYTVTQADIDAGEVRNTATATATDPAGDDVDAEPASARVGVNQAPALTLVKSASPSDAANFTVGQVVTYSFAVHNTGNVTLHGVTVDDTDFTGSGTLAAPTCPQTTLAPGASTTCTSSYTITQDDVDAGRIVNEAVANAVDPADGPVHSDPSSVTLSGTQAPALSLVKTAGPATVGAAGDTVTYTFHVTNTGNVTVRSVGIGEVSFTGSGAVSAVDCPAAAARLAPGDAVDCTATYTVSQADIDRGDVQNSAEASGLAPDGTTVTSPVAQARVTATQAPALSLVKSADPSDAAHFTVGQKITYSFVVTNTGNVTMREITVDDTDFSGSGTPTAIECPSTELAPGAQTTCTSEYTLTQDDLDAGHVSNSATATGQPPSGDRVPSPPSQVVVPAAQQPAIGLVKTASRATVDAAGDTVAYTFRVTNTGNVTVRSVAIDETAFTGTGSLSAIDCPAGAAHLVPGAFVDCTATYRVTQADIDRGDVQNTAAASALAPDGATVTSPEASARVTATSAPALTVVKSADPADAAHFTVRQKITYSFVVTNTGNVTLHDVAIDDMEFSGSGAPSAIVCPQTELAPGAQTTCTAEYTLTQADVDAGLLSNTATASGTPPTGDRVVSPPSRVVIPSDPQPALSLVKTADAHAAHAAGDRVVYTFEVTNTGTVTVHDVTIDEVAFSGTGSLSQIDCPDEAASLAPGARISCTATYTVTAADLATSALTNTATATGTDPSGDTVTSPQAHASVTMAPPAEPDLPRTGGDLWPSLLIAAGGLLLLLIGGGIVLITRGRRA